MLHNINLERFHIILIFNKLMLFYENINWK